MQNNPKISIIVPIYNGEKYIKRCMESIYSQTFSDYEIILVDDGSKDCSASICQEYAEKDKRIIFISKENEGAGSARNMGIEKACGEYLAFPDADDWFEPNMYEELYALAKSGDYDVVFSGANIFSDETGELKKTGANICEVVSFQTQEDCRKNVMKLFPTSLTFDVPWNKLYKRSVAIDNNVRFSNTRRCQDAMFNIDFYNAISSVTSTNKAYYNYITNTQESTNRKFPRNYIDINIAYFDKLISTLKSWDMYYGDIKKHYDTSFVISVFGTMHMFDNPNWNLSKVEKKEYVKNIMAMPFVQQFVRDADIRDDVIFQAKIIQTQNYKAFMRCYRREKFKNKLRRNKFLIKIIRLIKR